MRLVTEVEGAAAVEYAVLIAGIAIVIVVAVAMLGTEVARLFSLLDGAFG